MVDGFATPGPRHLRARRARARQEKAVAAAIAGIREKPGSDTEPSALEAVARHRDLVPQGGGDPARGHRCPGEDITIATLATLATELAHLDYEVPDQDLTIPCPACRRLPAADSCSPARDTAWR
ncbi:hypothetical protein [Streptomyces sp. NPDC056883]|uniref:hypothetical protein n=1 Tax=Streptomyces sp. NPDC056883 TaxID=3345959 RepID=UPI0036AD5324